MSTDSSRPHTRNRRRFGLPALIAVLALTLAAAGIVAATARRAVTVPEGAVAPRGEVRGSEPVRVRFSHEMARESVEAHFHITPDVPGDFNWIDGRTLIFTPRRALPAGQTYTVTIDAGARAASSGATLDTPITWRFTVRPPRVVALAPASSPVQQIVLIDPQSGAREPLTDAEYGVLDYAVSPTGRAIAYSERTADGGANLWVLDLLTGARGPITDCVAAVCSAPAWSPDGRQIAYQRAELDPARGSGTGPARAWIVDLDTLQPRLLFEDAQALGVSPTWSPDGARVAAFDATIPGIRVRDLGGGPDLRIESLEGASGAFAPDGARLLVPVLVRGALGESFYTQLELVDLARRERTRLSGEIDAPVEDAAGVWSPDGASLVLLRRYLDARFTPGRQIYRMDAATGEVEPLVVDPAYTHSVVSWDAAGARLVFQRFPVDRPDADPSVWTLDLASGALAEVLPDAFVPAWVP